MRGRRRGRPRRRAGPAAAPRVAHRTAQGAADHRRGGEADPRRGAEADHRRGGSQRLDAGGHAHGDPDGRAAHLHRRRADGAPHLHRRRARRAAHLHRRDARRAPHLDGAAVRPADHDAAAAAHLHRRHARRPPPGHRLDARDRPDAVEPRSLALLAAPFLPETAQSIAERLGLPELLSAPDFDAAFAAASVDGILAECSLSTMPDRAAVLREWWRVLAEGGRLALSDVYRRAPGPDRPAAPSPMVTWSRLAADLTEAGFEIEWFEDCSDVLKSWVARFPKIVSR